MLHLQLMQGGYPVTLLQGWRQSYIRALEQAYHGQYNAQLSAAPLAGV